MSLRWFDPAWLRDDYTPSEFKRYEVTHRAAPGHIWLEAQQRRESGPDRFFEDAVSFRLITENKV